MPYVINEVCASEKNAGCAEVCPVDCIRPTPEEAAFAEDDQPLIDPRECIDCGACLPQCLVDAISTSEDMAVTMLRITGRDRSRLAAPPRFMSDRVGRVRHTAVKGITQCCQV